MSLEDDEDQDKIGGETFADLEPLEELDDAEFGQFGEAGFGQFDAAGFGQFDADVSGHFWDSELRRLV